MHEQSPQFLLAATFTDYPSYMKNKYVVEMSICKESYDDRPYIICRMFEMKVDSLMNNLMKKKLLGKTASC